MFLQRSCNAQLLKVWLGGGHDSRTYKKTRMDDDPADASRAWAGGVWRAGRAADRNNLGFGALRSEHLAMTDVTMTDVTMTYLAMTQEARP
jgi:hypothetical protein